MAEPRNCLWAAADTVHAKQMSSALFQLMTTRRTMRRLLNGAFIRPRLPHTSHNFRDHIVASANPNRCANSHLLALNVSPVIQRSFSHSHTIEIYGFQVCQRCELARSAELPCDLFQDRNTFFGLKFIRYRPTRKLVREAHLLTKRKIANFNDNAVNQEIQRIADFLNMTDTGNQLFAIFRLTQIRTYWKAVIP